MKEILQEYGKAVITACAAILLLVLMFGGLAIGGSTGFFEIVKVKTRLPQKEYSAYIDAEKVSQMIERKPPEITWKNVKVKTGSEWKAEDLFVAEDEEYNAVEVEMIKAECPNKSEVPINGNKIKFIQQGVYRIWVEATDANCAETQKLFYIPVGSR